jgi:hypothetical protein
LGRTVRALGGHGLAKLAKEALAED